jgi:ParB/RepB/Spo0J family partition protein
MEFSSKKISVAAIDLQDRSFKIRVDTGDDELKESVEKTGIINCPYLMFLKDEAKYKIVCGFRRIKAASDLGLKDITANIIDDYSDEKELFLLALHDNLAGLPLNLVEKANAVKSLLKYFQEEEVIKKYLHLLGLPPVFSCLEELLLIEGLDSEIKQGIVNGTVAKKNGLSLSGLGSDGLLLYRLFMQVNLSTSKQAEIIDSCCDILRRDRLSIPEIINEKEITEALSREDLTLSQKGDKIRLFLRKKRFPMLIILEDRFLNLKKKLGLSKNIRFEPPPSFEGDVYSLQLNFRNVEELKSSADRVKILSENPLIKGLLEKDE